jgi:hypothetical protein
VLQRCFLPYNTGAELECADYERGVTPLMRACALNKLDCVRLLLELNGDTAAVDCDGWTVFETAYEEIKQLLLVHKKKKVSFLSLSLSLCYSQGVLGATPNRVATTDIESNSLRTRYSIDAICSTGNHWYMSRLLVARSTAIRFALDHRLVAKLRSTVASEEDSLDRIRSRFDSEIETISFSYIYIIIQGFIRFVRQQVVARVDVCTGHSPSWRRRHCVHRSEPGCAGRHNDTESRFERRFGGGGGGGEQ